MTASLTTAPPLTTDRLTLAGHTPGDLADNAAMWRDPLVYGPIGGRAFSREEVWHRILRYIGHWQVCGYGQWVVRTRADGTYVGEMGVMDSRRATDPSFEGTPEVGWALASSAHGRGYAREALAAVLGWADARGMARTMCIIFPANAPSIRLAERVGYRLVTEARYNDKPTLLFERRAGSAP